MPPKYSHVKKRGPGPSSKKATNVNGSHSHRAAHNASKLKSHVEPKSPPPPTAAALVERTIAKILLIRFEQDIARLFSTHLYYIALHHLPTFVIRCVTVAGPGWPAANADCEQVKDFFRAAIAMDLRQAGERVATKSVLWSYTAIRHFATSNNVPICRRRGLHSQHLVPHYAALNSHLETLQAMPPPTFTKPPQLGPLTEGYRTLEKACGMKYKKIPVGSSEWDSEWKEKVTLGYDRMTETLWAVAREFDVRGYGTVLREKLEKKWCDCGCSTDHLSEVCERIVKEEELESRVRSGKEREWDGRGSGVCGWETTEEEDIWEIDLAGVSLEPDEFEASPIDSDLSIGDLMEWRYLRAEREKEQGNKAFKRGEYDVAIECYNVAHQLEPEMPHYKLNLAAAYLKMDQWVEAEKACDAALSQHRSVKALWRRAQSRKGQARLSDATADLRAILEIQPNNTEAAAELKRLAPLVPAHTTRRVSTPANIASGSSSAYAGASSSAGSSSSPMNRPSQFTSRAEDSQFKRTYMDDYKLQISSLTLTIDVPVDLPPLVFGPNDRIKRSSIPPLDSIQTKLETFTYPSWERYYVQKLTK